MFQLGRSVQSVDANALILWQVGFRVEQIEFQLSPHIHLKAHVSRAFQLPDQRLARVDRNGLVVHSFSTRKTDCHAWLPRHGHRFGDRKKMHIRVAIAEVDIRRVPDIAGHIDGKGGNRHGVAVLADVIPVARREALATHDPVGIA